MENRLPNIVVVGLLGVTLMAGLVGGVALDQLVIKDGFTGLVSDQPTRTAQTGSGPDTQLINEAWKLIDDNYVDREAVESQRLTYGAISGMVDSLGDAGHSVFLSPEIARSANSAIAGEFEGIGAYVEFRNGYVVIVTPIDDSPALKAGLKAGDIVVKVDGEDMTGKTMDDVISRILGPAGTQVTLTIADPKTGDLRDVTITRAKIILHDVSWAMIPGTSIAYIRISNFSGHMTDDLKQAIGEARDQGVTGIILDLRNNPGGLLDEAVSGTSQFVGEGNVLLEQDAKGEETPFPVEPGGVATDLPLVVLINGGSASAAEIASGAIQDAGRGILVGETTFGTGTVLNQFDLSDGSSLRLATALWLTPKGRVIWHQGIAPDVEISLPNNVNPLLPRELDGMTEEEFRDSDDVQLLKALEVLLKEMGAGTTE